MNVAVTISSLILVAAVASYFAIIPGHITLRVGNDCNRVNEIGRYGYGKSTFSLRHKEDATGKPLRPSAFAIGPDGYHLLIWHNGKIESLTHFRHEQTGPNTYGDWQDVKQVDTFTVERPSPIPFFVGIAILCITGYLLKRFPRASIVSYVLLILIVLSMVFALSTLAETFAILPMLVGVGWLAAPILGRSIGAKLNLDPKLTR